MNLSLLFFVYSCDLEREISLGDGYYLLGDYENTVIAKKVQNKKRKQMDHRLGNTGLLCRDTTGIYRSAYPAGSYVSYFNRLQFWAYRFNSFICLS